MKRTAFLFFGAVALSAVAGGFAAIGVDRYFANNNWSEFASKAESVSWEDSTPQAGNHFAAYQAEQYPDLTYAAENAVKAVVNIESIREVQYGSRSRGYDQLYEFFGIPYGGGYGQPQTREQKAGGSGVIISPDGYIVTNNHVIDEATKLKVKLNDGRTFDAKLIGTDPTTDVALIKIDGDDLPTLKFGNSDDLRLGEWVLAIGSPFNLQSTITAGIVSAKARQLGVIAEEAPIESFIQTDAAVNPGNSGGALVNTRGELVGINTVIKSSTGSYIGYSFAVPETIVRKVVMDLKEYGVVQRAWLGIEGTAVNDEQQMLPEEIKAKIKETGVTEGILVARVVDNGSASGILEVDDIILAIDGKKIKTFGDLQETLAKHRPGDKVTLKVLRNKKEQNIEMVLKNEQGTTKVVKDNGMEILGAAFRELPDETRKALRISTGVEVTGVTDGKMKEAGIRKGFIILKVNGQSVKSVEQMEEIVKSASRSTEQVLFISGIFPSGRRANYAVDLSDGGEE